MKIITVWTMPTLTLRERLSRTAEAAWRSAAHRLPRRLAYWSLIDSGVRYMETNEIVPDAPFMVVLERSGKAIEK